MPDADPPRRPAGLARSLRAIRRLRGRRPADVAAAMGLPLRSYEHFEAGGGRLNPGRVHRYAEATESDAYAILVGLWIGSPDFAVHCADNKLVTILVMALQDFVAAAGEDVATLDARTLIDVLGQAFNQLATEARRRGGSAQAWIAERAARLPPPGEGETG